jgi:hypothetical protein
MYFFCIFYILIYCNLIDPTHVDVSASTTSSHACAFPTLFYYYYFPVTYSIETSFISFKGKIYLDSFNINLKC